MFGRRMPLKSQNKKADSFFVASMYISNTAGWKQNTVKNFFPRKAIKKLATFPRKISNSRLGRNIRYFKISTFCARRKGLKDFAEKEGLCLVYILDLRRNLKLFARYHSSFASYAHVLEVFAIPTRKGRKKKNTLLFWTPTQYPGSPRVL